MILILYLFSADAIFDTIIPVTDESRIQDLSIPNETHDMTYFIDSVHAVKLEWKDVISIQGWSFNDERDYANPEIFVLLDSGKSSKSFNTFIVKRPDVTNRFNKSNNGLDNSGFIANIPIYHLSEGRNRIVLILRNTHGSSLVRTNHYITKINDCIFPDFLSEIQEFDLTKKPRNISFRIDEIKIKSTIMIKGWAFISDQDDSGSEKYLLLESENSSYIFDTITARRPDVTAAYKNLNRNLNESGLYGNILINSINDGRYRIGIIFRSNNETSCVRSNQFIIKINETASFQDES
jgi:hypothetical protein